MKYMYLYELDSANPIEIGNIGLRKMLETIADGNVVVMTLNQVTDNAAVLDVLLDANSCEELMGLIKDGRILIHYYGSNKTVTDYILNGLKKKMTFSHLSGLQKYDEQLGEILVAYLINNDRKEFLSAIEEYKKQDGIDVDAINDLVTLIDVFKSIPINEEAAKEANKICLKEQKDFMYFMNHMIETFTDKKYIGGDFFVHILTSVKEEIEKKYGEGARELYQRTVWIQTLNELPASITKEGNITSYCKLRTVIDIVYNKTLENSIPYAELT